MATHKLRHAGVHRSHHLEPAAPLLRAALAGRDRSNNTIQSLGDERAPIQQARLATAVLSIQDATMAKHYVAYLLWNVREDWNRLREQARDAGPLYPFAFGSNWRSFPKFIRNGTILWIVSAPLYRGKDRRSEYRLPPTLIARLAVSSVRPGSNQPRPVRPEQYRWVAEADRRRSYYLPINNAFYALTEVKFVNQRREERQIPRQPTRGFDPEHPYKHVPLYLQNLSPLAPGSEQVLETLARQIKHGRTLFLSYARKESGDYAASLIEELRGKDFAPWLDLTFVPQDAQYRDPLLEQILDDGLRQSRVLVALTGPDYRNRQWTNTEWSRARQWADKGRLRILQVPVGGELMDPTLPMIKASDDPAKTAEAIGDWVERQT
jgi:hypothetical protein